MPTALAACLLPAQRPGGHADRDRAVRLGRRAGPASSLERTGRWGNARGGHKQVRGRGGSTAVIGRPDLLGRGTRAIPIDRCVLIAGRFGLRVSNPATPTLVALHGEMSRAANRAATERLAASDGEPCLVLATGRYIGEGFDEPRLDTILLAMPIAWRRDRRPVRRPAAPRLPRQARRAHLRLRGRRATRAASRVREAPQGVPVPRI